MKIIFSNEEVAMVITALRRDGNPAMYKLSDRIEAEVMNKCLETESGEHEFTQPEDTETIKWNDHGICRACGAIGRLE